MHYQLLDGIDILNSKELPVKFSNVILYQGSVERFYDEVVINTDDIFKRG
ncbi:MAG: hypothetical protein ACTSQA_05515 [Candidatus Heimdallarchaeaceae archaeon]